MARKKYLPKWLKKFLIDVFNDIYSIGEIQDKIEGLESYRKEKWDKVYKTIERVYATRIDCITVPGRARLFVWATFRF